jgi:hypothetical protein
MIILMITIMIKCQGMELKDSEGPGRLESLTVGFYEPGHRVDRLGLDAEEPVLRLRLAGLRLRRRAAGGSRIWLTVAIKQRYGGHAKQAGLIASQCHAGAYANRVVVVVDDDIDPADMDQVVWAMCTRFERGKAWRFCAAAGAPCSTRWPTAATTRATRASSSTPASRGCAATFPIVARSSKELDAKIRTKWAHVLPRT